MLVLRKLPERSCQGADAGGGQSATHRAGTQAELRAYQYDFWHENLYAYETLDVHELVQEHRASAAAVCGKDASGIKMGCGRSVEMPVSHSVSTVRPTSAGVLDQLTSVLAGRFSWVHASDVQAALHRAVGCGGLLPNDVQETGGAGMQRGQNDKHYGRVDQCRPGGAEQTPSVGMDSRSRRPQGVLDFGDGLILLPNGMVVPARAPGVASR
jgi:hypothetical protein